MDTQSSTSAAEKQTESPLTEEQRYSVEVRNSFGAIEVLETADDEPASDIDAVN